MDSYTKLLCHFNGEDESTTFIDEVGKIITAYGNVQIDTSEYKFGGASGLFDGNGDYLTIPNDNNDFDFGSEDFTIDWWEYRTSANGCPISRDATSGYNAFMMGYDAPNLVYMSSNGSSWDIAVGRTMGAQSLNQWVHYAIVRNGNTFYTFKNGIQSDTWISELSLYPTANPLAIGVFDKDGAVRWFGGQIDELRISKGIARWTSNFTPPTEEYNGEVIEIIEEDTITLSEETILTEINILLESESDTLTLSDAIILDLINLLRQHKFTTNFITRILKNKILRTVFYVGSRVYNKFVTDFRTRYTKKNIFGADFRTNVETFNYDLLEPKKSTDIIVKLDGSELLDVDYSTLNISQGLGRSPSSATFVLARYHDKLDYYLDGTPSEITDENKIEIFDDTTKLFTGYITQINTNSDFDTITVKAEDSRYKINKKSLKIYYGGYTIAEKEEQEIIDTIYYNTKNAIEYILNELVSVGYITGYETIDFGFIGEPTDSYADCGSLLDTLIHNSANVDWYIDENEYLRFTKVGIGTKKTLALSSLDKHRSVYDVIVSNIVLNRQIENYCKCLEVSLGKKHTLLYTRVSSQEGQYVQRGTIYVPISVPWDAINKARNTVKDFEWFAFQQKMTVNSIETWYCGQVDEVYGVNTTGKYPPNQLDLGTLQIYLNGWFVYQWAEEDSYIDLPVITVGSGEPKRKLILSTYGQTIVNTKWEHRKVGDSEYLYYVIPEHEDFRDYAEDTANFELSQNNQLITEAQVTLLLDAFEYYGISLKDLINLSNTIQANIYNNDNGFPLNISGISINCATRIVTLSLTNYGKTYYRRLGNYLSVRKEELAIQAMKKQNVLKIEIV